MLDLPLYEALLNEEMDGITCLSLVENPATETSMLFFDKDKPLFQFKVEDEEKQIFTSLIMCANRPIYRVALSGYEYYIIYSKETLEKMSMKMMKEGTQNLFNFNHETNNTTDCITCLELYIKDIEKGINPKGFEDVEDGSLFGSFKVEDKEVWEMIKANNLSISLEGYFTINEINNNFNKNTKMSKLEKIKQLLVEFLSEEEELKFGSTTTDNGIVIFWDGELLEVGKAVQIEDKNGNKVNSTEDYTITMEDYIVTIEKGIVTNIEEIEKEVEEVVEEPIVEEVVEEVTEEVVAEEEVKEEEVENPTNEGKETDTEAIVKLREEVNELYSIVDELKKELEELKSKPTEKPIEQEFEQVTQKELKGASRYTQYIKK